MSGDRAKFANSTVATRVFDLLIREALRRLSQETSHHQATESNPAQIASE